MNETDLLVAWGAATVRVATPLALAALGETISERGGVLNLGIEGAMLGGALGAAVGAMHGGAWMGVAAGTTVGVATGLAFGLIAVVAKSDQIISGTAITLALIGITGLLAVPMLGSSGTALQLSTLAPVALPGLSRIPILGPVLFVQSVLTYLAVLLALGAWWLLWRTRYGLELRAAGESPEAARAAGVSVTRVRLIATLIGGGFAGLAGASLVLAQVGGFAERMTAGRGFIAVAIVVLGRWHPLGALLAALLFGATSALQYLFQAADTGIPYQALLALPYLLALAVLATAVGRSNAPAGLTRN
jgi:simple sugar transport system permease protein